MDAPFVYGLIDHRPRDYYAYQCGSVLETSPISFVLRKLLNWQFFFTSKTSLECLTPDFLIESKDSGEFQNCSIKSTQLSVSKGQIEKPDILNKSFGS